MLQLYKSETGKEGAALCYHYYYCCRHRGELVAFLENSGIRFRLSGGEITPLGAALRVRVPAGTVSPVVTALQDRFHEHPVISAEYTPGELAAAEWLFMTPQKQRINIINAEEAYRYGCTRTHPFIGETAKHAEQIGVFIIAKEPVMNTKTAFWAEDTGFSEVFADWRVRKLAEENGLPGVEFRDVMLRSGEPSAKLYQMTSSHVLPLEAIVCGHGEKALRCPYCGRLGYQIGNEYQLHLQASYLQEDSDMYITERIFGEGIAYPLYLISQRFYRLLVGHQLAGSVTFSPVVKTVEHCRIVDYKRIIK